MSFDLADFAAGAGVDGVEQFAARCELLRQFLEKANESVNLTRITGFDEFNIKHAADSLMITRAFPELIEQELTIADIGCGAGFPSLILALAFPHWRITAIDSIGKKVNFVREAAEMLKLNNLTAVHGRSIELNRQSQFQKKFRVVTARAVAPSPKIFRETEKFPVSGGRWIFYKTPAQAAEELPELNRIKNMEWRLSDMLKLPGDTGERVFVRGERQ